MKMQFAIVIFIYVTFTLSTIESTKRSCYHCPTNYDACMDRITKEKLSKLEKRECQVAPSAKKGEKTTPAGESTSKAEEQPARLIERAEDEQIWKCIKMYGQDNATKGTIYFRGCSLKDCRAELSLTLLTEAKCEECDTDYCNLSGRINPFGWILLLITIILVCIEY